MTKIEITNWICDTCGDRILESRPSYFRKLDLCEKCFRVIRVLEEIGLINVQTCKCDECQKEIQFNATEYDYITSKKHEIAKCDISNHLAYYICQECLEKDTNLPYEDQKWVSWMGWNGIKGMNVVLPSRK